MLNIKKQESRIRDKGTICSIYLGPAEDDMFLASLARFSTRSRVKSIIVISITASQMKTPMTLRMRIPKSPMKPLKL
jgi:hypothetical protein